MAEPVVSLPTVKLTMETPDTSGSQEFPYWIRETVVFYVASIATQGYKVFTYRNYEDHSSLAAENSANKLGDVGKPITLPKRKVNRSESSRVTTPFFCIYGGFDPPDQIVKPFLDSTSPPSLGPVMRPPSRASFLSRLVPESHGCEIDAITSYVDPDYGTIYSPDGTTLHKIVFDNTLLYSSTTASFVHAFSVDPSSDFPPGYENSTHLIVMNSTDYSGLRMHLVKSRVPETGEYLIPHDSESTLGARFINESICQASHSVRLNTFFNAFKKKEVFISAYHSLTDSYRFYYEPTNGSGPTIYIVARYFRPLPGTQITVYFSDSAGVYRDQENNPRGSMTFYVGNGSWRRQIYTESNVDEFKFDGVLTIPMDFPQYLGVAELTYELTNALYFQPRSLVFTVSVDTDWSPPQTTTWPAIVPGYAKEIEPELINPTPPPPP